MRENAGLALIRPVEASALVAGTSPTGIMSIDAWGIRNLDRGLAEYAVSFLFV